MTLPKFELDTTRLKGLDDTAKAIEIQRQLETWKATLSPSELEHFTVGSDRQIPELIFYALVILLALVAYCSANRSDVDANMKPNMKPNKSVTVPTATSRGATASGRLKDRSPVRGCTATSGKTGTKVETNKLTQTTTK